MTLETLLTKKLGIEVPLICGPMYPCSNPELVAAASEAGGIGIIQPMSLVFAHGYKFEDGLRRIHQLTNKPVGFNAIIEKTISTFEKQMRGWIDAALERNVRFFVTALGNPRWVVRLVEEVGGTVFHDVTERKWALKALDAGVHGLICVNNRAGGHAGPRPPEALLEEMGDLGVPLICAGGVGDPQTFAQMIKLGYAGAQAGTRFIATYECSAHDDYKQAILQAQEHDIALTDKLSGIPCSIIKTPTVEKLGLRAGPVARRLLRYERTKRVVRTLYALQSMWRLKRANALGSSFKDYYQAGKSVAGVHEILSAAEVVKSFADAARTSADQRLGPQNRGRW
ncbi:MAG: 2-nitropropane dioxygenase [Deltaproteobacteria bacterium RIFOXYA12_FULL_58_15]|nr:MAG: 2-nitropropane dioxygenase [Deltaproteobacteria bacterium RIFOXYA12_FULL_58_15]OGR09759.1 MAG: 2-nitropropane dioxygenase [Deltaproteobacteria bacterium RIFOXYB12_FULL_58_9]